MLFSSSRACCSGVEGLWPFTVSKISNQHTQQAIIPSRKAPASDSYSFAASRRPRLGSSDDTFPEKTGRGLGV